MRPPKKVLLVCSDTDRHRELRFVITTRGNYRMLGGVSRFAPFPDIAIVVDDIAAARVVADTYRKVAVPLLVIVPFKQLTKAMREYPAPSMVVADSMAVADLLELIKVLSYRKRGPQKKVVEQVEELSA